MKSFAFITISKGRLHHIKQTLPLMIAQGSAEVIVVDYACPDGTGDWVEKNFPAAKVVRCKDETSFCVARARNFGARAATSEWLVFVDADIMTAPGWHKWMQGHVRAGNFYRASPVAGKRDLETWGSAIVSRADFVSIGGYDAIFRGWGGEDTDLYDRLVMHGRTEAEYPSEYVSAIPHGDEERAGWYGLKDRQEALALLKCYSTAKQVAMKELGFKGDLPLEYRQYLMMDLRLSLHEWFRKGGGLELAVRTRIMHNDKPFYITVRAYAGGATPPPATAQPLVAERTAALTA